MWYLSFVSWLVSLSIVTCSCIYSVSKEGIHFIPKVGPKLCSNFPSPTLPSPCIPPFFLLNCIYLKGRVAKGGDEIQNDRSCNLCFIPQGPQQPGPSQAKTRNFWFFHVSVESQALRPSTAVSACALAKSWIGSWDSNWPLCWCCGWNPYLVCLDYGFCIIFFFFMAQFWKICMSKYLYISCRFFILLSDSCGHDFLTILRFISIIILICLFCGTIS